MRKKIRRVKNPLTTLLEVTWCGGVVALWCKIEEEKFPKMNERVH